jgi:hypothetical protein
LRLCVKCRIQVETTNGARAAEPATKFQFFCQKQNTHNVTQAETWGAEISSQESKKFSFSGTNEHESQGLAQKLGIICKAMHPQAVGAAYRFPNLLWSLSAPEGRHIYNNTLDNRKKLRRSDMNWCRSYGAWGFSRHGFYKYSAPDGAKQSSFRRRRSLRF